MMHVTFLDHSGFLVELPGLTLLFDWWKGDLPPLPSGPLLVFASHRHPDHFDPRIFALDDGQAAGCPIPSWQGHPSDRPEPEEMGTLGKSRRGLPGAFRRGERLSPARRHRGGTALHRRGRGLSGDGGRPDGLSCRGSELVALGGRGPVWNRNMEADFRRYAEPLRGRKIDLAMLPLDPRLGEDGFRGPRYFLELADIRRFLPMHQWGNFNFTNQFLSCYTSFTSRTVYVNRVGQVFTFEEEADT